MKRLILRLGDTERMKMQTHLLEENYMMWRAVGYAIGVFQLIMLIMNIMTPSNSPKLLKYRCHYIFLIVVTLIALVALSYFRDRKDKGMVPYFYMTSGGYVFCVFIWAIGITLVGFEGSQDLSTYAYTTIATCAIVLLEPFMIILLLVSCTTMLTVSLFANPALGADIGTFIQLVSTLALAIIVTVVSYNRRYSRVLLEYDQKQQLAEIRLLNMRLQNDAMMDALTSIYNRRYLTEHIDDKLNTGQYPTCVLMIDIDYFKQINDRYGHQVGDECLTMIGRCIREIVNDTEGYAVRYGGEEFLICYESMSKEELVGRAQKLQQLLSENELSDGKEKFHVTVSIGYAMAEPDMNYSTLIGIADEHLYQAKENGRNIIWPRI